VAAGGRVENIGRGGGEGTEKIKSLKHLEQNGGDWGGR